MKAFKTTLNRAKQTLDEQFGDAQKTELDAETTRLLQKAEDIKVSTEKILAAMEMYLQPDPTVRILPGLSIDALNKGEVVGQEMTQLGTKLGMNEPYGVAMLAAGDAFTNLGRHDREFLKAANDVYVAPMRKFMQEDLKLLDQERKTLNNKRLDMDSLRDKATKAGAAPAAQQEFAKAQEVFNDQLAKLKGVITKIESRLPELKTYLKELVQRQLEYLNKQQQTLTAVQTKL
jgi:endophilin-B